MPGGKPRAAISWSGGKDSRAALHRLHANCDVVSMVTMFDEGAERSRSHGLRRLGVDPCGERGEYHTVVTGSRLFSRPLRLRREGHHVQHSGRRAVDLVPDADISDTKDTRAARG